MVHQAPNGLELSCPAEAGNSPLLYGTPAGSTSNHKGPARRVSFSELLGGLTVQCAASRGTQTGSSDFAMTGRNSGADIENRSCRVTAEASSMRAL